MSKARELAELGAVYDSGALSNRNLIKNGAMQVHQRGGTTSISSAANTYVIDRFRLQITNSATIGLDCSQSTDAPDGFDYSLKLDVTTAYTPTGGVNVGLIYPMERIDASSLAWGSSDVPQFTVSFWVKSNKTGTYSLQAFNNGGSTTALSTYTINSASTWERKTVTFNGCPTSLASGDTAEKVRVIWHLATGPDDVADTHDWDSSTIYQGATGAVNFLDSTSNELYLTGAQLEVGTEATPFEHRSFGDELARCQRYYYRHAGVGTNEICGVGISYDSDSIFMPVFFPVSMRAGPSLDQTTGTSYFTLYSGNTSHNFTGFDAIQETHKNGTNLYNNGEPTGMTTGNAGWVRLKDASANLAFDAEL